MIWSFVVKLWDLFNCTLRCCWTLCDEFDILLSFKFCKLSAHSCYCWIDVSELLRVFTDRPCCSHAAPTSIRKIIIHYKYPFSYLKFLFTPLTPIICRLCSLAPSRRLSASSRDFPNTAAPMCQIEDEGLQSLMFYNPNKSFQFLFALILEAFKSIGNLIWNLFW